MGRPALLSWLAGLPLRRERRAWAAPWSMHPRTAQGTAFAHPAAGAPATPSSAPATVHATRSLAIARARPGP